MHICKIMHAKSVKNILNDLIKIIVQIHVQKLVLSTLISSRYISFPLTSSVKYRYILLKIQSDNILMAYEYILIVQD